MPQTPTFTYEEQYWSQSIVVAGVDEAGMGALAGPVVAAAVVFDPPDKGGKGGLNAAQTLLDPPLSGRKPIAIRDSKTLSAKQRERGAEWIKQNAVAWAISEASVADITEYNIRAASHLAMQRAIDSLQQKPDTLLIDGTPAQPHPTIPATNIIDGDAHSFSIAAASILAKTHRDAIMLELDEAFPAYSFASHKGYGAAAHMQALREHGPCEHHRPTYAPVKAVLT